MKLTLLTDEMPELLPMRNRSPGIHISGIIHDLCIRLGRYDEREGHNQALFEFGNAWEHAVVERMFFQYPGRFMRLGELKEDGLIGTPDLYDYLVRCLLEVKLTWMSVTQDPQGEKFWRYWVQVMAYCYMLGIRRARLIVCFVNGNYPFLRKGGKGELPQYRDWMATFTDNELASNWLMLKKHAEREGHKFIEG